MKVWESNSDDLKSLLNDVVDDEHNVDKLTGHDEVVKVTNISQKFHCLVAVPSYNSTFNKLNMLYYSDM